MEEINWRKQKQKTKFQSYTESYIIPDEQGTNYQNQKTPKKVKSDPPEGLGNC